METPFLFEDESPRKPDPDRLILVPQPKAKLSKAQQTFNGLVRRIEKLRVQLDQETRRLDAALAYYGQHLHPRVVRSIALRKEIICAAAPFLEGARLKAKDRATLRKILAEQLGEILQHDGTLDDELKKIFKRVHGLDFAQAEREDMDQARSAMEAMFKDFGIKVDLSDLELDASPEKVAAKAAEMEEQLRQLEEEEERAAQSPNRRRTKRQIEREALRAQAEELRGKSMATIYKQLAKVLHPDLEPDPDLRQSKSALMQELTAAYHKNDLHTLLRLELQWIEREKGDLQQLTDQKLTIYNQILKEQADELRQQLAELPFHPRYHPIAVPDGPFDIRLRTDGPAEARILDADIADMEQSLARLNSNEAIKELRDVIRTYRAASRDPFADWFQD